MNKWFEDKEYHVLQPWLLAHTCYHIMSQKYDTSIKIISYHVSSVSSITVIKRRMDGSENFYNNSKYVKLWLISLTLTSGKLTLNIRF